jgi:hypothetical protein
MDCASVDKVAIRLRILAYSEPYSQSSAVLQRADYAASATSRQAGRSHKAVPARSGPEACRRNPARARAAQSREALPQLDSRLS